MSAWLLLALVLLPVEALACATCVGAPWQKTDAGFYWSALFLMGVPFAVAGIIGGWLFYHSRRAQPPGGRWGWLRFVGTGMDFRAEGRRPCREAGPPRGEARVDVRAWRLRPSLGGGLRPPSDASPLAVRAEGLPTSRRRGEPRGEARVDCAGQARARTGEAGPPRGEARVDVRAEGRRPCHEAGPPRGEARKEGIE